MAIIKLHCLKSKDEIGKNIFELCRNEEPILLVTFNPKQQKSIALIQEENLKLIKKVL